jgi:hypothetical protein
VPTLTDRAEAYIRNPESAASLVEIVLQAVENRNGDGLFAVRRLFEDMYGGELFNSEIKWITAPCLVCWGALGVNALVEATLAAPEVKNLMACSRVLASVASGGKTPFTYGVLPDQLKVEVEKQALRPEVQEACRSGLSRLLLNLRDDDLALNLSSIMNGLAMETSDVVRQVFSALSGRWLAIGDEVLRDYEELLVNRPSDEPAFQSFLTVYPQLIDPLAVEVWPLPDLHGAKQPDFVVRRFDDSYLVAEIECPAKILVTQDGHLSAKVTQAENQVIGYRTFLRRRHLEAQRVFPHIEEPEGLVIVGLERNLSGNQRQVLANANAHKHGLRIVGFDYLASRARAVTRNAVSASAVGVRTKVRMI